MNHYPRHIGDWRTATYNLTRVQRSIYSDLIDHYYDKERPIEADLERLAKDQGCNSEQEKADLRYILERYFKLDGGVFRHERCDEEIARFHYISEVGKRAGKASATARSERKANASATTVQRFGNALPTDRQPPKTQDPIDKGGGLSKDRAQAAAPPAPDGPPHDQDGGLSDPKAVVNPPAIPIPPPAPPRKPSKKCPKDFAVTGPMLQWAISELGLEETVVKRETDKLRDHTFGRTITDWVGAWRNWMRKTAEFSNHRSHQKGGVGAALERKQQTDDFIAAVKGAGNATGRQGAIDIESRVIRDGEEHPFEPSD